MAFKLCVKFCRLHAYVGLTTLLLLFLWWNAGEVNDCGAQQVVKRVCDEYFAKDVTGDLCKALCESRQIKAGVCDKLENGVKATFSKMLGRGFEKSNCYMTVSRVSSFQSFKNEGLVTKVSSDYEFTWPREDLPEGVSTDRFLLEVKKYIKRELGINSPDSLLARLYKNADVNSDDRVEYL
ncbi:hypothetical protein ElyMa_003031700 [Elysia marginata]|uniref:FAM69 N-terminal domain-containing protein n=1 Tax=Elysia marginata TaxID=1093978 RepID=A0AAV4IJ55_9GAST|nr:hypothetical protein ElyMa_003031700 [Elysia marginata]